LSQVFGEYSIRRPQQFYLMVICENFIGFAVIAA